jgi:hypothetical protein
MECGSLTYLYIANQNCQVRGDNRLESTLIQWENIRLFYSNEVSFTCAVDAMFASLLTNESE